MSKSQATAIVVGGSSGLGAATANKLRDSGMKVVIVDLRTPAEWEQRQIEKNCFFECDISSEQQVENTFSLIAEKIPNIRVGINCAGIIQGGLLVSKNYQLTAKQFSQVIDINLKGSFYCMQNMAQVLADQPVLDGERGVIINTSSIAAEEGQAGQTAYAAAKGGVAALTLPAARDLARHKIRVVSIAPGMMQTPMLESLPSKAQEKIANQHLFPERPGYPEEFACLVMTIINNKYLNGTTIRLDGGTRLS